jgi:hypothetical protein
MSASPAHRRQAPPALQVFRGFVSNSCDVGDLRIELDNHFENVQRTLAAHFEDVMRRKVQLTDDELFDLRWKHVDAANDQHVVRPSQNLCHSSHRTRRWRQQPRPIARAVTDDRQGFFRQRREDQLADFAIREHRALLWVHDFGVEMVFPDDRSILRFNALAGHPWSITSDSPEMSVLRDVVIRVANRPLESMQLKGLEFIPACPLNRFEVRCGLSSFCHDESPSSRRTFSTVLGHCVQVLWRQCREPLILEVRLDEFGEGRLEGHVG